MLLDALPVASGVPAASMLTGFFEGTCRTVLLPALRTLVAAGVAAGAGSLRCCSGRAVAAAGVGVGARALAAAFCPTAAWA